MALRALAVPVLGRLRPVQHVLGRHALAGMEVEPALTARFARARVPRDAQRLEPPARKGDEELLEGLHAEAVGHLVVARRAVRPLGLDDEAPVAAREGRDPAEVLETRAVEVTE